MLVKNANASSLLCPLRPQTLMAARSENSNYVSVAEVGSYIHLNQQVVGFPNGGCLSCMGNSCAMWREAYDDYGYCGLAGQPINLKALFHEGS